MNTQVVAPSFEEAQNQMPTNEGLYSKEFLENTLKTILADLKDLEMWSAYSGDMELESICMLILDFKNLQKRLLERTK